MPPLARPRFAARSLFVVVSAGAVLAASACGARAGDPDTEVAADGSGAARGPDESPGTEEFREGAIPERLHPVVDISDLPEEPESDAPLSDRMAWTALKEVTEFGGKLDPDADTSCPEIGGESGESVTCDITYLGTDIEYRIEIEESGSVLRYDSTADGMPLVREVVEAGLRSFEESEHTVCDMDAIELVTPNEDSGIECRALHEDSGDIVSYTVQPTGNGAPLFIDEDTEFS